MRRPNSLLRVLLNRTTSVVTNNYPSIECRQYKIARFTRTEPFQAYPQLVAERSILIHFLLTYPCVPGGFGAGIKK